MRAPWEITREMFLSFEEVEDLLDHVRSRSIQAAGREVASAQLDRLIVECLLFSGLRTSELCRLRVADTIVGTSESVFIVRGKPGEKRTTFVPTEVSRLVQQFVDETRPTFIPKEVSPDDERQPLLFGERKRPYERTGLYRRVVRVLAAAGLRERASVQLLRHTYGYLAYARSGGNLLFVQRQLGHAHPMITSIYAQFVDERYEEIAEQVFKQAESSAPSTSRSSRNPR